ncbi:MAG: hypothetical protein AAFP87_12470 [Pseudomonadota bacterium]
MPDPRSSPSETYRLLAGIISLKEFTSADLADATGVNPSTTKSWLQRSAGGKRYVFRAGQNKNRTGRGRPAVLWKVREEVVDSIRDEIGRLSNMAEVSRALTSQEEADKAYADEEFRESVRFHLFQAEKAESEEARKAAIEQAQKWFDFELDRLVPWRDLGFEIPKDVRKEIANLHFRMVGLSRRVDALQNIAFDGLFEMAGFLHKAIEKWCAMGGKDGSAFEPLSFEPSEDDDIRHSLEEVLNVILQTAEQVTKVKQSQVLCALLVVLARIKPRAAHGAICDVLDREGHEKLGRALIRETQELMAGSETAQLLHQMLVGIREYPRLLSNNSIGMWVDGLQIKNIYDYRLAPAVLYCLERRPAAAFATVARERRDQFARLVQDIEGDGTDWARMNDGVKLDIQTNLEKLVTRHAGLGHQEKPANPDEGRNKLLESVRDLFGLPAIPAEAFAPLEAGP